MKNYFWLILIFGVLLFWVTYEYFDHKRAFDDHEVIEVKVLDKSCGNRSRVYFSHLENKESIQVTRKECKKIESGTSIKVLKSDFGNYYKNKKPHKRIFWLYVPYIVLVIFTLVKLVKRNHA